MLLVQVTRGIEIGSGLAIEIGMYNRIGIVAIIIVVVRTVGDALFVVFRANLGYVVIRLLSLDWSG